MASPRRKAKPNALRSEVFALRLDPRLKYLAEFASRTQRRSLANYVEWAIESALKQTPTDASDSKRTAYDEGATLWDLDESERFIRLAERHPNLLTYEEQILWKTICTDMHLRNLRRKDSEGGFDMFEVDERKLIPLHRMRVKRCWKPLTEFSEGQITRDQLTSAIIQLLSPKAGT